MNVQAEVQNYADILELFVILGIKITNETLEISDQAQQFEFSIKDVYPFQENKPGFIHNLHHWCFPEGVHIYDEQGNQKYQNNSMKQAINNISQNSKQQIQDKVNVFNFVITDENSLKRYCTCLQVFELRKLKIKSTSEATNLEYQRVFIPKSYCLISRLNLLEVHKQFLAFIYKYVVHPQIVQNSISQNSDLVYDSIKFSQTQIQNFEKYANNYGYREAQKVAINNNSELKEKGSIVFNVREEFVFNFLFSYLKTIKSRQNINQCKQFSLVLNGREIFTLRNCVNKLFEIENFSYKPLFMKLSIQNIIDLIQSILLEKQIIIFSNNPSDIIHLCEALFTFIRPLTWNCLYIPFLPTQMIETLHIMVPYIIGIHRNNKDQVLSSVESENKVFLDLDSDYIIQDGLQLPEFLKFHLKEQLRDKLKNYKDTLKQGTKKEQNLNFMNLILNMKKIFLQFMISLINNYLPFFLFPTDFDYERDVSNEIFDFKAYFRFLDASSEPFYQEFVQKTMIFRSFIEETYKILRQVEVFNRDIRDIRDQEAPQYLIEFIKEIQKLNSYIQLQSQKRIEITNVNVYKYPDLLHTLNLEHSIIINNYMQELQRQNFTETKNELLKYLIFFQKDLKKKQSQNPFYPSNIKSISAPLSPILEQIGEIPIINLDEIQNDVDKTITKKAEESKQHIFLKQPYFQEYNPDFQILLDNQNQIFEIKEFEDQSSKILIPQFAKNINIKHEMENHHRQNLSIQEFSTNELIIPYPSPNRNNLNLNQSNNVSKEFLTFQSQQRLHSEQSSFNNGYNGMQFNSQNNFQPNGIMFSTETRWNKFEQPAKNTGTSSQSLKRNSRKIFENTVTQFSGNYCSAAYKPRTTLDPNNQRRFSNNIKQKAKTDMSIEEKNDTQEDLRYHIFNNQIQIKEDTLGEDAQDEDYKFFKIEEVPKKQIAKKDKSLSPNRSDIPEENQVDTVPDFFRGELEMKNIVTLNIDQITSCHTFRKKESSNQDKTKSHFKSVQNFGGQANTQRSLNCQNNFAFTSIEESELDNEYNHNKSNEEEFGSDPLLEIRNHFFQDQLSPVNTCSRFSLSNNPFTVISPVNQGSGQIPQLKSAHFQPPYFKNNKVSSNSQVIPRKAIFNTLISDQNKNSQYSKCCIKTEENLDNRFQLSINQSQQTNVNTQQDICSPTNSKIFSYNWKIQNGIQLNTQITIDEEDNQALLTNGSQIFSQGIKSPTQKALSPQSNQIINLQGIKYQQSSMTIAAIAGSQNHQNLKIQQKIKNNYFHTENVQEEENENLSTEPRDKPHQTQLQSRIIFNPSSQILNKQKTKLKVDIQKKQSYLQTYEENKFENTQIKDDPLILKDYFSYEISNNKVNTNNNLNKVKQAQTNQKIQVPNLLNKAVNQQMNIQTESAEEEKKMLHKRRGNSSQSNLVVNANNNRSLSQINLTQVNQSTNNANINHSKNQTGLTLKQYSETNRDIKTANYSNNFQNNTQNKKTTKFKIFDQSQNEKQIQQNIPAKIQQNDVKINQSSDVMQNNQNQINTNLRTILQNTQNQISKEHQAAVQQEKTHNQQGPLQPQQNEQNILKKNNSQVIQGKETISHMLQQRRQSKEQYFNQKFQAPQTLLSGENKLNYNNQVQNNSQNSSVVTNNQNDKIIKQNLIINQNQQQKISAIKQISQQNYFLSKNNQVKTTSVANQNKINSKRIF
ncbi:DENN domain protein (macronuclear) [Tetrahymena thermophila SB210]|uniref:DENN domain protein n=1 Tax=Tetrahymena thermophila (strain SB210) TaxID=312017 RepID=I7LTD3_TETTS|nr:DENN domain protein [Tetrahymena thermophila SB210]EAR85037.2 DENN domain protein [Tetrahymena thermophila SB210]|eukprot:XP_001032700.2 DENN domain protein [Tetrahymena thermophila SB210]